MSNKVQFQLSLFSSQAKSQAKLQAKSCRNTPFSNLLTLLIISVAALVLTLAENQTLKAADGLPNSGSLLIHFEKGTSEAQRQEILDKMNATLIDWTEAINMAQVKINAHGSVSASHSVDLFNDEAIAAVEQDSVIVRGTYMPNDPALQERKKSYAQEVIQIEDAWDYTLGHRSAVIAVLDTGLNPQHIEFGTPVIAGYNFVDNNENFRDDHGHGTHISGIIAAQINNSIGTVGVCPQCGLIAVKVLNADNYGTWSTVAKGIVYAVDNGADIINLSLGSDTSSNAIKNAIIYAQQNDVLIIAASGNEHSDADFYPAAFPGVIGVSATNDLDEHWVLSNYGHNIDLSAPGYMIYSTGGEENYIETDGFSYMTGTSMAAPHVAGVAGLLLSQDANRSAQEITEILLKTSDDLGEQGWDPSFGHGRINAAAALADAGVAPTRQAQEITEVNNNPAPHSIMIPFITK